MTPTFTSLQMLPIEFLSRIRPNSLGNNNNNKLIAITTVLIIGLLIIFPHFDHIQTVAAASQQQENKSDNNNGASKFSLSTFSTAIGTGAAVTGVIVTIPGVLRTRNQSKNLSTYLLKIHDKHDEFCNVTGQQTKKQEYLDSLNALRREVIYLLQRRDINENQFKMLDDKIIEYSNKIADFK
ncbi:MAG: hypothetical protein JO327_05080 [Nitrososphaeraceae archaeon]|nr:hypothetical protein [Nitrososphaeraceae archaeon]MBV9667487.1 hypothetical protein [Nitrososphaeraceae archaeon]